MSLFKRASTISKKFKISVYGPPGVGKTILALSFPNPAVIDMEHGTDWYAEREVVPGIQQAKDFLVLHTKSVKKVISAVNELEKNLEKDADFCHSVIVDPITLFWDGLQEAFISRMKKIKGENFKLQWNHWKDIKAPFKATITTLLNLPVHLILVGREAIEYDMKKGELVKSGTKMQSEKDTPYVADIHMRMFTQMNPKTNQESYYASVEKDRTHILKKGTIIENCCYSTLCELRSKAGVGASGQASSYEKDEEVVEQDEAVFNESNGNATASEVLERLITDPEIKKLWKDRLDWAPGKVKAVIMNNGLNTRELLGKHLADIVRSGQSEGTN